MSSLITNFRTDENFWKINPVFLTAGVFKTFHDKDKSKGKAHSSKMMWAIALYVDKSIDNVWRNMSDAEKEGLIAKEYLKDEKFKFSDSTVEPLVEEYFKRVLSPAQKELKRLEDKIIQRGNFIANTGYTLDEFNENGKGVVKGTADQLDKMLLNTSKIYDMYEAVMAKLAKEEAQGTLKGDAEESAGEGGLL